MFVTRCMLPVAVVLALASCGEPYDLNDGEADPWEADDFVAYDDDHDDDHGDDLDALVTPGGGLDTSGDEPRGGEPLEPEMDTDGSWCELEGLACEAMD